MRILLGTFLLLILASPLRAGKAPQFNCAKKNGEDATSFNSLIDSQFLPDDRKSEVVAFVRSLELTPDEILAMPLSNFSAKFSQFDFMDKWRNQIENEQTFAKTLKAPETLSAIHDLSAFKQAVGDLIARFDEVYPKPALTRCRLFRLFLDYAQNPLLTRAAASNELELLRYLIIELGADLTAVGDDGKGARGNAAHHAADNNCLKTLKFLSNYEPKFLKSTDSFGRTPLAIAAQNGFVELVEFLLSEKLDKIDLEQSATMQLTPLHLSAIGGHLSVFRLLEKHGANMNADSGIVDNGKAVHIAAAYGHLNLVKYILQQYPESLEAQTGEEKRTPLSLAVSSDNVELVAFLVEEMKANVEQRSSQKSDELTPFLWAVLHNAQRVVRYLAKRGGVDVEAKDRRGCTALQIAADENNFEMLDLLLSLGFDVNKTKGRQGRTVAHDAASVGNVTKLEFLLRQKGADCQLTLTNGRNCLHLAALGNHLEAAKLLIDLYPELVQSKDAAGETPEQLAQVGKHQKMVELLQKYSLSKTEL